MTFCNTSGNVLKIVTKNMVQNVLKKCGNMYGNANGKPKYSVVTLSIKAQEIPKGQIDNSE